MKIQKIKAIVAIFAGVFTILAVLLASLGFNLEIVDNLVLSWIATTIYSVFLFFLFDNFQVIERVRVVEKPVIREIIKEIEKPIQIPVENRTIQVVDRPIEIVREIPVIKRVIEYREKPKAKKLNIPKYKFLGSTQTKRYHKRTCRLGKLIKKRFKLQSNSQKFFVKKRFKACKSCFKK